MHPNAWTLQPLSLQGLNFIAWFHSKKKTALRNTLYFPSFQETLEGCFTLFSFWNNFHIFEHFIKSFIFSGFLWYEAVRTILTSARIGS